MQKIAKNTNKVRYNKICEIYTKFFNNKKTCGENKRNNKIMKTQDISVYRYNEKNR